MDEPTTPLSSRETDRLFELIRPLRAEGRHRDHLHQPSDGGNLRIVGSRLRAARWRLCRHARSRGSVGAESLVKMMVGRDISGFYKKQHVALRSGQGRAVGPRCRMAAPRQRLQPRTSLGRSARNCRAGRRRPHRTGPADLRRGPASGRRSSVDGKTLAIRAPRDAIDAGVVYLTEDRKRQGLFLDMSVRDNINVAVSVATPSWGCSISPGAARGDAISSLSIRVASAKVAVGLLSGGNQQKVLLSRWLETEPTRPDPRRTHARRRHRRQVRDLSNHQRTGSIRRRHHRHLERITGSHRRRRPRARHARRRTTRPARRPPARRSRRKPSSNWQRARAPSRQAA